MISKNDRNTLLQTMVFYAILSYLVAPTLGFNITKNKEGITHGMIAGTVISIFLWYEYGSKKLDLE
jgi:Na+/proline symporter